MRTKITLASRTILIVLLVVFIFQTVAGAKPSQTKFGDMQKVITKYQSKNTTLGTNQTLKRLYKINPSLYEGAVVFAPNSTMDANEMLLVKLKDKSQGEQVKALIEARKKTQLNTFKGYGTIQTDLLNKSIIDVQPNYVLYVVGENAQKADEAFRKAL
ncbi:MAG: DUF4358 domain-containing protein [Sharpea porci]|uniref:DUF4358 domain-containing protein n=1 Tax=Sharpea porci TaxID=2652286 RepID=UPI00240A503C|nr:DUF4358 domain-containing protein [Sharpea porci]MDD6712381.1 DUF4358 domain-containing protein [Sharpea porci]